MVPMKLHCGTNSLIPQKDGTGSMPVSLEGHGRPARGRSEPARPGAAGPFVHGSIKVKNTIKALVASTALVAISYAPASAQNIECGVLIDQMNASPLVGEMNDDLRGRYDGLMDEARGLAGTDDRACVMKLQEANTFAYENTGSYLVEENSFEMAQAEGADSNQMVVEGATAATGGQLVVEQQDPQVDVVVPDPTVSVTQAQPEVIVEQAEPEIVVQVPKPTVEVQQQAPIITVTQAEPTITVTIPEPTVTIRMPEPEVNVDQAQPQVAVSQAQPTVRFIRPEPRIRIEQAEADVSIAQGDANVQIEQTETAALAIRQAEPEVTVQQSGEANVEVSRADAQVNVEQADPNIQVEQAEANIVVEGNEAMETAEAEQPADAMMVERETADLTDENVRNAYVVAVQETPFYERDLAALRSADVYDATGENIGSINDIVVNGSDVFAILEFGGFLGIGDDEVPVPLSQLQMGEGDNVIVPFTEEQLEAMPEYDPNTFRTLEPRGTLAESLATL